MPTLANGQRSVLIVVTDRVNTPNPRLLSAWLIVYVPTEPRLTYLPIYPAEAETDWQLSKSFHLNKQRGPGGEISIHKSFLDVLQERDLWWSGYLVLDRDTIAEIGEYFLASEPSLQQADRAGVLFESESHALVQTAAEMDGSRDDPAHEIILKALSEGSGSSQEIIQTQAALYQEMCRDLSASKDGDDFEFLRRVFTQSPGHMGTDLNIEQIITELKNLRDAKSVLFCDFPTLSLQTIISN
ncbi:MAG: hypothetical protein EHM70_00880 [Chloroflexota bacterium]|nr:MAG: hypothetical protein EHM70_00880 [Chloroflexota bacterium]